MIKFLTVLLGFLGIVAGWIKKHFSATAKARKKAVKDGKQGVSDRDRSDITNAFDKLRNK